MPCGVGHEAQRAEHDDERCVVRRKECIYYNEQTPQNGKYTEAFMTAACPGIVCTTLGNKYYDSHEAYVRAVAREMRGVRHRRDEPRLLRLELVDERGQRVELALLLVAAPPARRGCGRRSLRRRGRRGGARHRPLAQPVGVAAHVFADAAAAFDAWGREIERLMALDATNVRTLPTARAA